jgi:nucleotide-binding universal stress UspA family protein
VIKDLLIAITHNRGDDAALAAGIVLAESHDAHIAALVCVPLTIPITFEWSAIPAELYTRVQDAERERGNSVAKRVRDALSRSSAKHEVRVVESQLMPPASVAALHARHADLAIVSGVSDETAGWADSMFLDLLMESGRAVFVVPPQYLMKAPPRHVVVAWQPTREAARALHESLPLLRQAETVDVLVVDPVVGENRHGEEPGADIATHLARHGLRVRLVSRSRMGETAATVIVRQAMETGAELVVAGGYSHTRMREMVIGGVTRSLLEMCPVPVLLSH